MVQPEEYIEKWRPEIMTVYVDENGLQDLYWKFPLKVNGVLNQNVPLSSFEEIKESIRSYIKFAFSKIAQDDSYHGTDDLQLSINKMVLTNMLIPVRNDPDVHMLVPAWVVYYQHVTGYEETTEILAINAIDGSNIDLSFLPPREQ